MPRLNAPRRIPYSGILKIQRGGVVQKIAVQQFHIREDPETKSLGISFSGFLIQSPDSQLKNEPLEGKFCFPDGKLYRLLIEFLTANQKTLKTAELEQLTMVANGITYAAQA
jgi:hypothetical protein